ncbi:gamma-1-syntrophin [Pectinophora gossypiella]|uniref:gamma-1-syntrophin n=1 Tax=Pectinophora gossypiella TaxID=13191 RepID=UPI00214F4CAD|nr:gamma-1-syntrophin [Pectinophora gossypiella]XP_049882430.1 gamma-1-syntrophin [Pectinophora gossypiella]
MMTPTTDEKKDDKIRTGMVHVSDGKSRPRPARLRLTMESITVQRQQPKPVHTNNHNNVPHARERMVQITRQKVGGLGLSIKGGSEHKLPILISKIYKDQAADQTGQLFVGDAVIKVNGEYITACKHDDAVNILRNAGDIVVLTVKHYRAATPFLQKQAGEAGSAAASDTDSSGASPHTDHNCNNHAPANTTTTTANHTGHTTTPPQAAWSESEEGSRPSSAAGSLRSRPSSVASDRLERHDRPDRPDRLSDKQDADTEWVDVVSVPLMMAYVTRYVLGTDKLRPGAFEVRGARPELTTGVVHLEEAAALSHWLKAISDNIVGLTNLQMKLFNRHLAAGERIEYMGWVVEGVVLHGQPWQHYRPKFLVLKGTDVMLFDVPPMNITELAKCPETLKVYQTMFRTVKESETVDWRQHCFLVQSSACGPGGAPGPRYFSAETRQELLRVEAAWTASIVNSVIRLGKKTFTVVHGGRAAGLTLDWAAGFTLSEGSAGAAPVWAYRFSQLRGSSDDGKSKLKLHFQDAETKIIETKELECQILQSLLFCMHAFLTAKVASVDPAFLASIHQAN